MNKGYDIADWLKDGGTIEEIDGFPSLEIYNSLESHSNPPSYSKQTQSEMLLHILEKYETKLFFNEVNEICVAFPVNGHTEVWLLESREFSNWLQSIFYKEKKRPIQTEGIKQALSILAAKAKFEKRTDIPLFNRVALHNDILWYDLSNEAWQVVKITADGWSVEDKPPILFNRYRHQIPQVLPDANGDIQKIFQYVNLKDYRVLFLCWLITCFIPDFPHAISIFFGEKGSAKTTTCELLKRLIDPSVMGTLALEKDKRTLVVNLAQHWYLPFDNISNINIDTSDMLCRAITGGGIQQRKMCTNAEDYIFTFKRCITLNGISNVANRADLLDRSLLFELVRVPESERKELRLIYKAFDKDRASILGGIFTTLSKALGVYQSVKLSKLPRMADFARWGYAIGEALGGYGEQFLKEYEQNQIIRDYEAIDADVVAYLIVAFMKHKTDWSGLVSDLLVSLQEIAPLYGIVPTAKEMPSQANALSRRINNVQSNLNAVGITYSRKYTEKGTTISLHNSHLSPLPPYRDDWKCGNSNKL